MRARITALGGVGKTTFTLLTGRLSAGIHLNPTTGTLRGKPRQPGTYRIVIEAHDALAAARRAFRSEHPLTESDCTSRVTNLEPPHSEKNCGLANRGCLNKR
jgi:hypothetical protein